MTRTGAACERMCGSIAPTVVAVTNLLCMTGMFAHASAVEAPSFDRANPNYRVCLEDYQSRMSGRENTNHNNLGIVPGLGGRSKSFLCVFRPIFRSCWEEENTQTNRQKSLENFVEVCFSENTCFFVFQRNTEEVGGTCHN